MTVRLCGRAIVQSRCCVEEMAMQKMWAGGQGRRWKNLRGRKWMQDAEGKSGSAPELKTTVHTPLEGSRRSMRAPWCENMPRGSGVRTRTGSCRRYRCLCSVAEMGHHRPMRRTDAQGNVPGDRTLKRASTSIPVLPTCALIVRQVSPRGDPHPLPVTSTPLILPEDRSEELPSTVT